jgi:acyl-CoA dehydrogenase
MVEFSRSNQEESFAEEVRTWLEEHLVGEFSELRNRGGTGREDIPVETLLEWEKELASGGWLGLFPIQTKFLQVCLRVQFHHGYAVQKTLRPDVLQAKFLPLQQNFPLGCF